MAHELIQDPDSRRNILIFQKKEEMWPFMTERFGELAKRRILESNRFSAALSGGNTPVDLYVGIGQVCRNLDWKAVHLFLVDERVVPYTDERSNLGMIKKSLIDSIPIPPTNVHAISTRTDPPGSAKMYEDELTSFFRLVPGSVPEFDLILLGLGEDGHTASLFPGLSDLENDSRLVRAIESDGQQIARISMTLRTINHGRSVFFLVTGGAKAKTVLRVVEKEDRSLPATLVRPVKGDLFYILDKEAGSLLSQDRLKAGKR